MSRKRPQTHAFTLNAVCLQCTGRHHLRAGEPCQDSVFFDCTDRLAFFGLADGQSGKRYSAEGGQLALRALCHTLRGRTLEELEQLRYPDELQYQLLHAVRTALQAKAAQYQVSEEEFASTLMLLMIDRCTGRCMYLHLGDGTLFGIPADGAAQTLSVPDNGWLAHSTWLTTSGSALLHLRVRFGSILPYRHLLLLTDGAPAFACVGGITRRTGETPVRSAAECLRQALLRAQPMDDATCLLLTLEHVPNNGQKSSNSVAEAGNICYNFISI